MFKCLFQGNLNQRDKPTTAMPARDIYKNRLAADPNRHSHWSGIGSLILLCLVSVFALTLFLAFMNTDSRPIVWNGMFAAKSIGKNGALFSNVSIGMRRSTVENVRPDLTLRRTASGKTVATFRADGANHTLWFTGPGRNHKVHRIRIERVYEGLSEYEILARFGRMYGNPVSTDCSRQVFAPGQQCHFRWLTKGGIPLDVHSRVIKDAAGASRTVLTVIAVDAYLEQKVKRTGRVRRHANLLSGR
jgi:hypothetical protein